MTETSICPLISILFLVSHTNRLCRWVYVCLEQRVKHPYLPFSQEWPRFEQKDT